MKKFLLVLSAILIFPTFIFAQSESVQTEQKSYSESVSAKPVREIEPYSFKKSKKKKDSKQKKEVEKIEAAADEMIVFPVSVYDRNGAFIERLKESDFLVYENGIEQKLEYFKTAQEALTIIMVLDTSPSSGSVIRRFGDLLDEFLSGLNPNEKIVITELGEDFDVLNEPSNDRKAINKGLNKLLKNDGSSVFDGISQLNEKALKKIEGQKVVIFLTDGIDTTSRKIDYIESLRLAETTNTAFFPVYYAPYSPSKELMQSIVPPAKYDVSGQTREDNRFFTQPGQDHSNVPQKAVDLGRQYLEELAALTGGKVFEIKDGTANRENAFILAAREIRNLYFVGYHPQKNEPGKREIKVRINRPNLSIAARETYFSGQN